MKRFIARIIAIRFAAAIINSGANYKQYKNARADQQQFEKYRAIFKTEMPRNLDAFQNMKYNDSEKWSTLQRAYRNQPIRDHIQSDAQPKTIEVGKQGKHIREHNNYIQGRSYLTISVDEAQTLVNRHAGSGELLRDTKNKWKHQELIRTKQQIGVDVDQLTGEERPTTDFKIHYSNKGVHIVPYKER